MTLDELISYNIKQEIILSDKRKSEIADEIGISRSTLSQYLSGRAQPTLATFSKLCKCLDCSADDILGIKEAYPEKE